MGACAVIRRAGWLVAAFAALVAGIEALRVLTVWWAAGRPAPGWQEGLAAGVLLLVGFLWWRHSVFACKRGDCLYPEGKSLKNPE